MRRLTTAWMNVAACRARRGRNLTTGLAVGAIALLGASAPAAARAAGCPNEEFRLGPSAQLPECRAYEMVSPVDKGDGAVFPGLVPQASPSGESVEFFSNSAFPGAPGSPLGAAYIARRDTSAWATESAIAPGENWSSNNYLPSMASSPDLSKTIQVSTLALTPGAIEGGSNIYLRNNLTGERTLIAAVPGLRFFEQATQPDASALVVGGSRDWSHIILSVNYYGGAFPLTPEASSEGGNLYDYTGGRLHLINRIPAAGGGEEVVGGASTAANEVPYARPVSADGSRVFFSVHGAIYMREDDERTIPISVSELPGEEGEVEEGEMPVANAAGTIVYFKSAARLTSDCVAGAQCLYRYDVETGKVTAVIPSSGPNGPNVYAVLGTSEDGTSVYFSSTAALAEGATEATYPEDMNFYVDREGRVQLIFRSDPEFREYNLPPQYELSPNGRYFAFATRSRLTAEDVASSACPNEVPQTGGECMDVYLYDAQSGALTCASCDGPPRGDSNLGGQVERRALNLDDEYPRAVLDDGTVFFDSPNQLVAGDLNRVDDVYEWREGSARLLSSGTSESISTFADASADGRDVFFLTDQPLVGQDADDNTDLYDARVDGGLASQWPPMRPGLCEGESCRSASPSAPAGLSFGSGAARAESCTRPEAAAAAATRRARSLSRRATRLSRMGGRGASKQVRRLRREALTERHLAQRLERKVKNCPEAGR